MIPIKWPREQKEQMIERFTAHYEELSGEKMGNLIAEQLLDFMMGEIGPLYYNQAIEDAQIMVADRMNALEDEFYAMKRAVNK